jgi:cell division protein FtsW (lipid II flippase)
MPIPTHRAIRWLPLALAAGLGLVGLALLRAPFMAPQLFAKQSVYSAIGLVAAIAIARFASPRAIVRAAYPLYAVALLALVLASIRGRGYPLEARALSLGFGIRVRVVEPMTLALVLALARTSEARAPRWLSPALALAPMLVALGARDFPSLVTFGAVAAVVLIVEGRGWLVGSGVAAAVAVAPLFWRFLHAYQRARVSSVLCPADPLGAGWMADQVREMMRAGGLFGAPAGHRAWPLAKALGDAELAFPLLSTSYGFVGSFLVLAALAGLVVCALRVAGRAGVRAEGLAAAGIGAFFGWKSLMGVAFALGLAPIGGVSAPMLGYGGTNVVASLVAAGLLTALAREEPGASENARSASTLVARAEAYALAVWIVAAVLAVHLFIKQVL